jgi:hypothetical protein
MNMAIVTFEFPSKRATVGIQQAAEKAFLSQKARLLKMAKLRLEYLAKHEIDKYIDAEVKSILHDAIHAVATQRAVKKIAREKLDAAAAALGHDIGQVKAEGAPNEGRGGENPPKPD